MQHPIIDNKYQIVRQLGKGGMGALYEARHLGTGRRVAVKVILTEALAQSADIVARFQREARASGAIESEHVAQVLDAGVDAATGSPYMVMELLKGEDMQQLIQRVGPLAPELALRLLAHACLGLRRAHEAGIIHRDIKSANLFVARRDSGDAIVKILDFGIAKVRPDQLSQSQSGGHGLTRTGSMMGSPLYMSPEQALGLKTLDHRTDIWSLGVVLYEALCGKTPHGDCDTIGQLLIAITSQQIAPIQDAAPWVAPEIATIVHKALAHDPAHRYQTAAEMHAAIMALLPGGAVVPQSMLVAMPAEMRAAIAPRAPLSSGAADSGPQPLLATPAGGSPLGITPAKLQSTTAGFGTNQSATGSAARKSTARWAAPLAGAVAIVTVIGAIGLYATRQKPTVEPATSVSEAVPPASSTAPSIPTTRRTVHVTVEPADALVEVDAVPATVSDGKVEISGDVGSVHQLHIAKGGNDTWQTILIADAGPIPSSVSALKDPVGDAHPTRPGGHAGAPPAASRGRSVPAPQKVPSQPSGEKATTPEPHTVPAQPSGNKATTPEVSRTM